LKGNNSVHVETRLIASLPSANVLDRKGKTATFILNEEQVGRNSKEGTFLFFLLYFCVSVNQNIVMEAIKKKSHYTIEEYLVAEEKADYKSEYYSGDIVAMAGGSPTYSEIGVNTTSALDAALKGKKCTTYNSDLKIQTGKVFVYPDASVVCGDLEYYEDRKDIITNPILIVEILSPSTSGYNKSGKFMRYRQLDSFQEYVLIQSTYPEIHIYRRQADNTWSLKPYTDLENDVIQLTSIEVEIPMSAFYDEVEFTEE